MTAYEVAQLVRGELVGEPTQVVRSAASLEEAKTEQISFVANRQAVKQADSSQAGVLLVPRSWSGTDRTVVRVKDPRAAFASVVRMLHPAPAPDTGIHPSAVIDPSATIGEGVTIGPFTTVGKQARIGAGTVIESGCQVGADVHIGSGCRFYPRVTVYHGVTIGERVILHSGAVIGADGFGFVMQDGHYEKFPQIGTAVLEDNVEIGANSCVDRAALGVTRIGTGTKLDNLVHIAHNCQIGKHVVIAAQTGLAGNVTVEDYAVIGGQVGIGDKARIESRAVLGSGCGILTSKIVRQGQVVWGTPARPLKEYLEQLALLGKLPELYKEIREIRRTASRGTNEE